MNQETHTHNQDIDFFVQCARHIRTEVDDMCRCRQCRSRCSPLSSICETCGTQDPIELPWRWAFVAGLTCFVLLGVGVWFL